MVRRTTQKKVDAVIKGIRDRYADHDFAGEILDDAWAEQISARAAEYLYDREREVLTTAVEDGVDDDALAKAVDAVLAEFIKWLGRRHSPAPEIMRVIITVRGGTVESVHSTDKNLGVDVLDWDNAANSQEARDEAEVLEGDTHEMAEVL